MIFNLLWQLSVYRILLRWSTTTSEKWFITATQEKEPQLPSKVKINFGAKNMRIVEQLISGQSCMQEEKQVGRVEALKEILDYKREKKLLCPI